MTAQEFTEISAEIFLAIDNAEHQETKDALTDLGIKLSKMPVLEEEK